MTFAELQSRLAGIAHRNDLSAKLPDFINDARERINRRFGLSLAAFVNPNDTNAVLTDWPLLYIYAGAQSMYEYLNNGDNAGYYAERFAAECSRQNISALSIATDPYNTSPPVIIPEV